MIGFIKVRERGATPRGIKRKHKEWSKEAWEAAGRYFHENLRDKRFTVEHGRKAGYAKRKGEELGTTGKAFWQSYTGRKLTKYHHRRPLEFSGEVRSKVRTARIVATGTGYLAAGSYMPGGATKGGGVKVRYPGASKLNWKGKSKINMANEFRRVLPEEARKIAEVYDDAYDRLINSDKSPVPQV